MWMYSTKVREILGHNYNSNVVTLRRTSPSNDSGVNLRGVVLDPKLTWDDHTTQLCKRLSGES